MGIDFNGFNNLIGKLGQAKAIEGDLEKIDTKKELNAFITGWDAIKSKADTQNSQAKTNDEIVDVNQLEQNMKSELAGLMGADFGEKANLKNQGTKEKPLFSDDEISLEKIMEVLSMSPVEGSDGINLAKLREYNKVAMQTAPWLVMSGLEEFGFDPELIDVIIDKSPNTLEYISNSIKDGSAKNISSFAVAADEYAKDSKDLNILGYIRYQYQK